MRVCVFKNSSSTGPDRADGHGRAFAQEDAAVRADRLVRECRQLAHVVVCAHERGGEQRGQAGRRHLVKREDGRVLGLRAPIAAARVQLDDQAARYLRLALSHSRGALPVEQGGADPFINSRVKRVPEHVSSYPSRDPSTGWRCHSAGGTNLYSSRRDGPQPPRRAQRTARDLGKGGQPNSEYVLHTCMTCDCAPKIYVTL